LQRRIFDPFFTTKAQGEGSGLGLPLCRNLVESHEGTISIASEPGHGTTVRVVLPVSIVNGPSPQVPEPVIPSQGQGGAILLIDDDPGVQKALRRLLQRRGYDVTTANNGREGLTALEARSFEVILCDMRMPDIDGPGFYRELESRHRAMLSHMIFLTGDTLTPGTLTFFAQVERPYLVKPFKIEDVRRVIEQVLEAQRTS
jgi:two-component system NtrC family sensor kinase